MTFDTKNMENSIGTLAYEQPSLKKYGTMKEFTLQNNGSGSDSFGFGNARAASDPKPRRINSADVTGGVSNTNDVTGNSSKDFAELTNSD